MTGESGRMQRGFRSANDTANTTSTASSPALKRKRLGQSKRKRDRVLYPCKNETYMCETKANNQTESKQANRKQASKQKASKQTESKQTESKQTENKQTESKQTESKQTKQKTHQQENKNQKK